MKTSTVNREDLLTAAKNCEKYAKAETIQEERMAMADIVASEHIINAALMAKRMKQFGGLTMTGRQEERRPIQVEGQDWAYVESRMPADIWWHLYKQKNYGWEGLKSNEGQKELRKAYPVFFPKQVSGKMQVGWTGNVSASKRVKVRFAPGTIKLV